MGQTRAARRQPFPQKGDNVDVERRLSDATLRALVDANFAVCYEWDLRDGTCLFVGHFDDLLGLSASEVPTTIEQWGKLLHPDDLAEATRKNQEAIADGGAMRAEYRMIRRDGAVIVVEDSGLVLADEHGEKLNMVGGLREVTAERNAQRAIEERNIALRVLLDQRRQDRIELERNITSNLRNLVLPTLDRLARSLRSRPEAAQLEALTATLEEISGPFGRILEGSEASREHLTRREYEVAQLIRAGKTTVEIAETLHIGSATVTYHRASIRRKLGLGPRSPHLSAYLASWQGQPDKDTDAFARLFTAESRVRQLGRATGSRSDHQS